MSKKEYLWLRNVEAISENNERLFNYDLSIFEGDIICVVCSSYSKQRLVSNLILGYTQTISGSIFINEKLQQNYDAQLAFSNGISSSESTNSLVKTMTIEHNLFALRERKNPLSIFNQKAAHIQTQNILNTLGFGEINNKLISDLTEYEQQMVCIAKSVINHAKVIVVNDTYKNTLIEQRQFIHNIKIFSERGVSFVIFCDVRDEFVEMATRIQYITDSGLIYEFNDKSSLNEYLIVNEQKNNNTQNVKQIKTFDQRRMQSFEYNDVILEKWFTQKRTFEISKNIDNYFIKSLSIKDNICLGIYPKLSTMSILNPKLIDFTFLEAKKFANIIKKDLEIDNLTHLEKLLLLIYRATLQNFQVIILNDIFSDMDDFEWSHLIKSLETLVEKNMLIYMKNCNSYLFNIKSPYFFNLDQRRAIMIKKDTK